MTLIVALAAFSIDVSQWYVGHHRAQVAADATALAAANCLASVQCTQTTSGGDAETAGNKVANANGFSSVSYAWTPAAASTNATVKVTVQSTTPAAFGGLFGIHSANTSASATASYNTIQSSSSCSSTNGASDCYSMFAGNDVCDGSASAIVSKGDYVGLDLVTTDHGSGKSTMSKVFSNAYYYNGGNSSASTYIVTTVGTGTTPSCTPSLNKGTTTYVIVPKVLPYPEVYTEPTGTQCTYAASWTTATIKAHGPGVFCVNTTPSGTCADGGTVAGDIDVDMSSLAAGGYEFVGPCVTIAGQSKTATSISGQPLVYGTSNMAQTGSTPDFATSTALPTCVKNDGTNLTSTFLDGSPSSGEGSTIYDQCGTAEITQNGGYNGFVEAWNISLDKNNTVTGNGPTSITQGSGTPLPGGDQLTN